MKPPTYTALNGDEVVQCSICGCLTCDPDRHTSFHEGLVRMLNIEVDD